MTEFYLKLFPDKFLVKQLTYNVGFLHHVETTSLTSSQPGFKSLFSAWICVPFLSHAKQIDIESATILVVHIETLGK
jgi:hypothetical protein